MQADPAAAGRRRHAIVLGGGIAGLLTARVLTDHFDRVTLVDRDRLPDGDEHRSGVPQSRHAHALLSGGLVVMERYFPGLAAEIVAAGASSVDQGLGTRLVFKSGLAPRVDSGVNILICSRALVESRIRRRLSAIPRSSRLEGHVAIGLVASDGGATVTGVRLRGPTGETTLEAELVIDASGRESRAAKWLVELGYPEPQQTVVDAQARYASCWFERTSAAPGGYAGVWIQSRPPSLCRAATLNGVEGNRWLLSLFGWEGDYPPLDPDGFIAFAKGLPDPIIHDVITAEKRLSPVYGNQSTANRLIHYDRAPRWPERFVVTGDAFCSLNPTYGQGMTVASLCAVALDDALRARSRCDLDGVARALQRRLAAIVAPSWMMATSEDARWPSAQGAQRTLTTRVMHWYIDALTTLLPDSPEVFRAFVEVLHMIRPATALFHPRIAGRVLLSAARAGRPMLRAAEAAASVPPVV